MFEQVLAPSPPLLACLPVYPPLEGRWRDNCFSFRMKLYYMLLIVLVLMTSFVLTSCSGREEAIEPAPSDEAPEEPVVFKHKDKRATHIVVGPQPSETPLGFLRFAGAIRGERASALIEIGGRGTLVSVGDTIGGFRVESIGREEVVLCAKD